jgi:hypothetical protein
MKDQIAFTMSIVLLAILFVLLAGLAGWLFTMSPTREPRIAHEPAAVHLTGTATGHMDLALTADGEDILRVDTFSADYPASPTREPVLAATSNILGGGAFGELPMICPQIGTEIRQQRYYQRPILHDAFADPSRVIFQLSEPEATENTETEEAQP